MTQKSITLCPIGHISAGPDGFVVEIDAPFRPALTALEGFSHVNVLWWCDQLDNDEARSLTVAEQPYKRSPAKVGIFATRSPARPNPIALTAVPVSHIDQEAGRIAIPFIDAEVGTPVIDIKPYHAIDRIKEIGVPEWCAHWPAWYEDAATFDWAAEFVNAR